MNTISDLKFYSCKGSSSCFKVELLLLELGLSFQCIEVDLWKKQNLESWFQRISPLNLVPAIELDVGAVKLSESNTILRYLVARTERYDLYPVNLEDRARVDQMIDMMSFSFNEDLGALIWQNYWVPKITGSKDLKLIEKLSKKLVPVLNEMDFWLTKESFLCGPSMTLADICLYSHLVVFGRSGLDLSKWQKIQKWEATMQSNPRWEKRVNEEKSWP